MTATATTNGRRKGLPEGVQERHQQACATHEGKRCNCRRSFRASIFDPRVKRNVYSGWKRDQAEVVKWRTQALRELESGTRASAGGPLLREAWADFHKGAKSGAIPNNRGDHYRPQALEGYERSWRLQIEPEFGHKRLAAISRQDLQRYVDKLGADGTPRSTVNNALDPLRVLYRRAIRRNLVTVNPTADLELPARVEEEMRFASREEAAKLIAALPDEDRALWATAFYAGLRRGELQAIRWEFVDLNGEGGGTMTVLRSWGGDEEGAPKSKAGRRRVPIVPLLAAFLKAHKAQTRRDGNDLVFGRSATQPFYPSTVRSRALKAWGWKMSGKVLAEARTDALEPITLHQCRHTAASFLIASSANAKALSTVMGHASIEITFNRYGHLMPGSEEEVGRRLAEYLSVGTK